MARTARIVGPEYPHHVTQRGLHSLAIFRGDEDRQSYLELMSRTTQGFRVGILAWWLMAKHLMVDHERLARIEKKTECNLQNGNPGRKPPDSMK